MKKLTLFIIGILLVGSVIAGIGLTNRDTTVELTTEQKTALDNAGFIDVNVTELSCDNDWCSFSMNKEDVIAKTIFIKPYYLNHSTQERIDYTIKELGQIRDDKIQEVYETIADALIERNARGDSVDKIGGGVISTTNR